MYKGRETDNLGPRSESLKLNTISFLLLTDSIDQVILYILYIPQREKAFFLREAYEKLWTVFTNLLDGYR